MGVQQILGEFAIPKSLKKVLISQDGHRARGEKEQKGNYKRVKKKDGRVQTRYYGRHPF